MEKNMGSVDRIIRSLIAALMITLYLTKIISGTLGIVLIAVSIVFLFTSFISFCPLYKIFGWSTSKKRNG